MSIHPSLNTSEKNKKVRSVLKRTERLKILMEKGEWEEGKSIFGLPKIKTARIKIKKEKAAPAAAAPAAGSAEVAPVAKELPKPKA
ncbi:MAG: small basic protein [Candidatus Omnitrophota bacterium]